MKKILVSLIVLLIVVGVAFAERNVLIDFSELVDDYQGEHRATLVDYSAVAGTRFTEEEKAQMQSSLYVPNWYVKLASSSRTVTNDHLSYVQAVTVDELSDTYPNAQVLGVRIHFPNLPYNSYAWVEPPFVIPAYATDETEGSTSTQGNQFTGFGVAKNVGVIKSISVNVYGMNYPIGMALLLRSGKNEMQEIPLGYLEFDGWRELTWNNPHYIAEVRNRDVKPTPLYPKDSPYIALANIQYYKDAMMAGGDFINYVKDITVTYDQAIIQDVDTDLDHEEIWGILSKREEERRVAEISRLGVKEVLRVLEEKRMHKDDDNTTE